MVLIPLAATLITAAAAGLFIFKRKSLSQAHCIQQATVLQNDLKQTLEKLLRLNPKAASLRVQRQTADNALRAAISSGNPYAIAAAQAYWTAVYLQQTALRAKQELLLRQAEQQRQTAHRELRNKLRDVQAAHLDSRKYYWRALAVEAKPIASLTPNYEPLPMFKYFQQHRFRFAVDLAPEFAREWFSGRLVQTTECAVTLNGKEKAWSIQILAANAAWN